jgi:molybdopterin molybdotransferase
VHEATLTEPVRHQPGRRSFLRAITHRERGRLLTEPAGSQGSHLIGPLVTANSLLIVPEDVEGYDMGDVVRVMLLREELATD